MWKNKEKTQVGGESFESVAASLTEQPEPEVGAESGAESIAGGDERLIIREEWAAATVRLCFLPMVRFDHPAWAPSDEVTMAVAPQMREFLQVAADKYLPQLVGKVAGRHPELVNLAGAMGVALWTQWRFVQEVKRREALAAIEERQRRARESVAAADAAAAADLPKAA